MFFIHPSRKKQARRAFLISKNPRAEYPAPSSQFVLLKVSFKDRKISTVILVVPRSNSSGNRLCVSSPCISQTPELQCCDPPGTSHPTCSRSSSLTGCNPPGTGAASSYWTTIELWVCKRAARLEEFLLLKKISFLSSLPGIEELWALGWLDRQQARRARAPWGTALVSGGGDVATCHGEGDFTNIMKGETKTTLSAL